MAFVVVTAAGESKRMQGVNKHLIKLLGKPVLAHTLQAFEQNPLVQGIVVTCRQEHEKDYEKIVSEHGFKKIIAFVPGGAERQDSVYNGLKKLLGLGAKDEDIVLIHNGANPLVKQEEINECIEAAREWGASVAAFPVKDTIKIVGEQAIVQESPERKKLFAAQTPQTIKLGIALEAFGKAAQQGFLGTDDVMLVERIGGKVKIVECSYENIKITTPEDVLLAEAIMKKRMR